MRLSMILALARAEVRSVRRLMRYWMFSGLAVVSAVAVYLYFAVLHGLFSGFSATVGAIGPRNLVGVVGGGMVTIFTVGLIFLAFDVRARDERERMAEVLDSRPMSNPELLVGRSLALVLMAWAPVLVVAILLQTFGTVALSLDWFVGEPVEPYSLTGFALTTLTVCALWCTVVMLLAVLLRNRLLVALAALVLLGLQVWGTGNMPVYLVQVLDLSGFGGGGSDLVPTLMTADGVLRLVSLGILAAGVVALSAAWHPRPDGGSRSLRVALGVGLVALASVAIGNHARQVVAAMDVRAGWRAAHQAHRDDPRSDLQSVTGVVRIAPGRHVELTLDLWVQAPPDRSLDTLMFTFNPGLTVERVGVGGTEAVWTHTTGLLEVTPAHPLAPGAETAVELVASGRPNTGFGYLDAGWDVASGSIANAQIGLLGASAGIFSSRYVALMPGLGWLPHPGSDVPAGDPRTHPADFFEVELEVEVPADWLVAGPGRRETLEGGGDTARFRFDPGAPVPHVGLLASRFERRAVEVAGVELEVLVHPTHDRNLRFFADAADAIAARAEEILTDAERLGLPYPYGGLTVVESPYTLRGYGGGWRMDTTQTMPGILLLRENSFPTSRFEFALRDPDRFAELEGGFAGAKVAALERYFENDVSGGNLFLGGSRNFLLFQTSARGEGALAIDFVLDQLASRLLTGRRGYFSAFVFQNVGPVSAETVPAMVTGDMDSLAEAVLTIASDRPSVWDRALASSLADLEPTEDAELTLNVLALKTDAIARSILDGLGREKTAALLAELRARFAGGHFDAADLAQVASELDADLEPLIGDWLHEATLPGFVTSPVVVKRLTDDTQGLPRYQTRVHVRNGESTPGLLRLRYTAGEDTNTTSTRWDETEPVRVAGHETVELGLVGSTAPRELWLQPYLSLNRQDVQLTLPRVDSTTQAPDAPFLGHRPSTWRPAETTDILVDDLDPGFTVEADAEQSGLRLAGGISGFFAPPTDMDQGLPEPGPLGSPQQWSRQEVASSWGRYRHTLALVGQGTGHRRAIFTATLPQPGLWRLAYHLPVPDSRTQESASSPEGVRVIAGRQQTADGTQINIGVSVPSGLDGAFGTYDVTLVAGHETRKLELDGAAAEAGWNALGEFELPEGAAKVVVSDLSSGRIVVADAIRWQPVSEGR